MPEQIKRFTSIFRVYRIIPLVLAGLAFLALLIVVCLLIWSMVAYYSHSPVTAEGALPIVIYLGAVFITAALMTLLIRGGTVFPAVAVSVIAAAATLFLAEPETVKFGPALLKILLTLLSGAAGFTLAKLWVIRDKKSRYARAASRPPRPDLPQPPATKLTPSPQPDDYSMRESENLR